MTHVRRRCAFELRNLPESPYGPRRIPFRADDSNQMSTPDVNEYLRTKVMTASPAELRLMLIGGAIRFAEQARSGLIAGDHEQIYQGSSQCRAILTELITSLQPEVDPLLCERLIELYTYIYNQVVEAVSNRDPEVIAGVVELLVYEQETWELAIARLAAGQEESGGADATSAGPKEPPSNCPNGSLNLSG